MIGTTVSHYRITEKLGEGGMGVVFKAEDTTLKRTVALKFLSHRLTSSDRDKAHFLQEAQAAASLNHPNICTIHGIEDSDGQLFIVMEFVEGESLEHRIVRSLPAVPETIRIVRAVAEGLGRAHERGVIHRDIKSENIMIGAGGDAKIMDFGLAKLPGNTRRTSEGTIAGTPAFMSPEQVRGEELDPRTDIWSLGVVMYEALTGRLPFPGQYESAVMYLILNEEPEPVSRIRPEVPHALDRIVRTALQKERTKRYQTVQDLMADLHSADEDAKAPVTAEPKLRRSDATRRVARESERRQVTVLFAGLTGITPLYQTMDPEEVSGILGDCNRGLMSIVTKYGGMSDSYAGEQVMATFGAPVAHENDPERAMRCAVEMMEYMERYNALATIAMPERLGLHIAVNTGTVVAGTVGSDDAVTYSVVGDTVTLASALRDAAGAGEIVVSENTYRIVSPLVLLEESRPLKTVAAKDPITVHVVRTLRSDVEPGTRVLEQNPIIGREQEITLLASAIQNVRQKSERRLFVRGEAGVGKTRLKLELIRLAAASGVAAYEGKCSSFEMETPYFLWTTLLKNVLQLGPDAGEHETRKRLHDLLQMLSLGPHEPYLATLLSLRYEEILMEEDKERKSRIYASLKELLRALAGRRPTVFVLEDVHWIDRFSQELLDYLFRSSDLAPALFVLLFRDEYIHAKDLLTFKGELVDLNRLTREDALKLMGARFGVSAVPSNVAEVIYKRSEGNPFFIEELIKTLMDRKAVEVRKGTLEILQKDLENVLPETVQGVIMARIDRLEERLKEVLFGASVIGREFNKPLLQAVVRKVEIVDPSLRDLLSLELILEQEEVKEFAYLFKHYLIQEVAYNTILQKKRKELHGLIARAIEKVYADKLKDFYELLAFHYERAEEWEKAADYLNRAGNKVREMYSTEESKEFFERKEVAKAKLLEARGEKSYAMYFIRGFFVLWALDVIGFGGFVIYQSFIKGTQHGSAFYLVSIPLWAIVLIAMAWAGMKFMQVLRPRPMIFDLFEDRIQLTFTSGKSYAIGFEDIFLVHYYARGKAVPGQNRWRSVKSFLGGQDMTLSASPVTSSALSQEMISPYAFGFGSRKGEIHIRKKAGVAFASRESFVKPWKVDYLRERDVAITPTEPKEFYDQLLTAYEKWRRLHDPVHAAAHPEKPASPALLTVRPAIRVLPALLSLNPVAYLVFLYSLVILPAFMMELRAYVFGKVRIGPLIFAGIWAFIFVEIVLFFLMLKWRMRKRIYEFYEDRLVFHEPGCVPPEGTIYYEMIDSVGPIGKVFRKVFKIGDLMVRTRSILRKNPFGIAVTGLVIPDVADPDRVLDGINRIIEAFKSKIGIR